MAIYVNQGNILYSTAIVLDCYCQGYRRTETMDTICPQTRLTIINLMRSISPEYFSEYLILLLRSDYLHLSPDVV